jgi:hypothetical protein
MEGSGGKGGNLRAGKNLTFSQYILKCLMERFYKNKQVNHHGRGRGREKVNRNKKLCKSTGFFV